jgi:hypothetical protein
VPLFGTITPEQSMTSRHLSLFALLGLTACMGKYDQLYHNPSSSEEDSSDNPETPNASGGSDGLTLPFATDEAWYLTRAYNTESHVDYGYDYVDDTYALDFALSGCESWRQPTYPIRSGTVDTVTNSSGYGNTVIIDHGGGFKSRYAHLDETLVDVDEVVTTDDVIGLVGNTGNVSGSACPEHPGTHLHLAYYNNGEGALAEPMSGHTGFTAGCWYGHGGWIDCDGDGLDDATGDSLEEHDSTTEDTGDTSAHSGEEEVDTGSGESHSGEEESDCTLNVPGDYSSIQSALDAAGLNEMICVSAGSYEEDLIFPGTAVTLVGIDGVASTHLYGQTADSYAAAISFESGETSATTLQGFTVHGAGDSSRVISLTGSAPRLKNLNLACDDGTRYGLYIDGATEVTAQNLWIDNCDRYGVLVSASSDVELDNLIVSDSSSAGVRVTGGGDTTLTNSVVYNSESIGVWSLGGDVLLQNSIVVGHTLYAVYSENSDSTFNSRYNTFDDNGQTYGEGISDTTGDDTVDPEFNDPTGGNFTLSTTSPCLDDGNPSSVHNDADGSRNDKGAYGGPLGSSW